MYEYQARIEKIIDGDTFEATVDLGFHTYSRQHFRLENYSAPEISGVEKEFGIIAQKKLEELLPVGEIIMLRSAKTEKFGRWLANVNWESGSLSDYLMKQGYGLAWDGRGPRPSFDLTKPFPVQRA